MASYNRHTDILPKLCNECLLQVCKATLGDHEVMSVLARVGRGFCSYLNYNVITSTSLQHIMHAKDDLEALFHIREAFRNSLDPHMIDQLLDALSMEEIGKSLHAEEIRKVYHRKIMAHKLCKNCEKGAVVNSLVDITTIHFTPEERKELAANRIINVMPLGESETGKTTLLRTIMEGMSSLAKERTSVASLHRWTPPQDPNVTALLYDVGGHKSYHNTAHCFQVNSESTLNFLCHRIDAPNMKQWCEATLEWFDIMQTSAPKSKTILVFTQVDRINRNYREDQIEQIKKEFKGLFQEKQDIENQHLQESDSDTNKELYQMHIQNCQDIIEQLQKDDTSSHTIPRISCVPREEDSVHSVVDLMLKFADNLKGQESLSPTDLDLFKEIGTLGLKKDMILEDPGRAVYKNPNPESQLTKKTKRMGGKGWNEPRETPYDEGPKHTVEKRQKLRQQYMTLTEVRIIFKEILKKQNSDKNLEKELQKSLGNLKKLGLIRYFTGSKRLAEIIFNDISTMVNILRCIFHHELSEFPEFRGLDRELRKELKETKYRQDVACLEKHAIISSALIKILLTKSRCSIGEDIVLELLASLNVAIPVHDEQSHSEDCHVAFIPYFLRDSQPDSGVSEKEEISKCYHTTLALHCLLKGQIPRTYFNELMVKLYGKMYKAHINQKTNGTWVDGLSASLGHYKAKLLLLYDSRKRTIEFIIQANIEEIEGHHLIFHYVRFIATQSTNIRDARFEGLPIKFQFIWTDHNQKDSTTFDVWDIQERLEQAESLHQTIKCANKDLPCALLQPLPKDEDRAKYNHRKLLDYLKKHYTEEPTPLQTHVATGITESHQLSGSQDSLPYPVQETGVAASGGQLAMSSLSERIGVNETLLTHLQIEELYDKEGVYRFRTRGRALIINIHNVRGSDERLGSEYDVRKLKDMFRKFGFQPQVYEDLNIQNMKKVLCDEWQKQNSMDSDAFFLCIMSHGGRHRDRDYICCSDGQRLDVDYDICIPLGQCAGLKEKPKIVIIQACRSGTMTSIHTDGETLHAAAPSDKLDMLIACATVPEWNCYREPGRGSGFIQSLVKVFSEDAKKCDIVEMLTKVRAKVADLLDDQVTEDRNHLRKKFYFYPWIITGDR